MAKMTLIGRRTSINVQKALWALQEVGADFEWQEADSPVGWASNPNYVKNVNPNGRVPSLLVDGKILHQSNVIVRYLAYTLARGTLWPEDPIQRAHSDEWMDWQQTENYANIFPVFWGLVRTPPEKRDMGPINAAMPRLHDNFRVLDARLKDRPYVAGDTFTMGDIPAGACTHRYLAMPLDFPDLPNLRAYYARLAERPAYKKDVMIPLT